MPGPRISVLATATCLVFFAGVAGVALAQELPVPCAGSACGANGPATWVTDGSATGSIAGNTFSINQTTQSATLNWASFNVGADNVVNFNQPNETAVALNQIFQSDPSRIFGAINANGQVYLINQNGIVFGESAQVNVSGLIASALNITPDAIENGVVGAVRNNAAAFENFVDENGEPVLSGFVTVENGAELFADGGQILLLGPEVTNLGTIRTPDGQTILAAGTTIYLAASDDPNLRGLVVEIDGEGIATNGTAANATAAGEHIGQIIAERGNVTIAALAVNQLGLASATTSIRQNGSVRLVSRRNSNVISNRFGTTFFPGEGGNVVIGENSRTEILLDSDTATTVDVNEQPQSLVEIDARNVDVLANASIVAPGGQVSLTGRPTAQIAPDLFSATPDDSRVTIADGVVIDVSGATAERSASDNVVAVELRGNQLADSPAQREGEIRSETVFVDLRQSGTRADGTEWQGTPLADASGEISNIERNVAERNLTGGSIALTSQGAVFVDEGAILDVSGGLVEYAAGDVTTSRLLGADGRVYDIADADPDRRYTRVIDTFTVEHPRWGVTEVFEGFPSATSNVEAAYVEGYDAGEVSILAPNFVLDGTIVAATVQGRYQRNQPGNIPADALYRRFNELPLGGQLTIGSVAGTGVLPNYVTGSIDIAPGVRLADLGGGGVPFDPLSDTLPDDYVSNIRPELLADGAVTRLQVFANSTVTVGEDIAVVLPTAATLDLTASELLFGADYTAPSGALTLTAVETADRDTPVAVTLAGSATVDLSGNWVNDNPLLGPPTTPTAIDGGTATIRALGGDAALNSGAVVDVSAGAYRTAAGEIIFGRAGSIDISATPPLGGAPSSTVVDADLRAYGFDNGGRLSITASMICIAAVDCADDDGELAIQPGDLFAGGFADVSLTSVFLGIDVQEQTQIVGRQRNLQIDANTSLVESGSALATFTSLVTLPDVDRQGISLSLSALTTADIQLELDAFSSRQGIRIGEGARIDLDTGSTLNLLSNAAVVIDGELRAAAGDINVALSNELLALSGRPPGAVVVGASGLIDVSGTTLSQLDSLNRVIGTVFDGGRVSLTANRDGILLQPGSRVLANGAVGELTVRTGSANNPSFALQSVGSNGGEIALVAGDYIVASGTIAAAGGDVSGTRGGLLRIALDGALRGPDPTGQFGEPALSTNARRIFIGAETDPLAVAFDQPIPANLIGLATIGADTIVAGGFHDVALRAETLFSQRLGLPFLASRGEIAFDGGLSLVVPGTLSLDAPTFVGGTGDVSLFGNAIVFGHTSTTDQSIADVPVAAFANGTLALRAGHVDLIGNSRIDGFADVQFASDGDLRTIGIQEQSARALVGSINTDAALALSAQQIYPTTLSNFTIASTGENGRIEILPVAGASSPVFSAAGTLTLAANQIEHGGTILAPFGAIEFAGTDVLIGSGSTTVTGLGDQIVPFGSLQGGLVWTYSLGRGQTLVFDGSLNTFPEQRFVIDASNVTLEAGAVVDVSGGGDLLAYEFVPGVGGSTDFLSNEVNPTLFAILPGVDLGVAPFDPAESPAANLGIGDAVFLSGVGDLPAGVYTLLPARYAILPGAILVSPVEGYTDILPGEAFAGLDGGVVIAGRPTVNGTDVLATRTQGFELLPQSRAFEEAQYDLALATNFFGNTAVLTPNDAGSVVLAADESLDLSANLVTTATGRGARVDIASDAIRLVSAPTGDTQFVEVAVDQLAALGAESIVVGGQRSQRDDATVITPSASVVEVVAGAQVTNPELILVGVDRISVGEGATLAASGLASTNLGVAIDGDAAYLRVSSGPQRDLDRSNNDGVTGDIELAQGATIRSAGSVTIDASSNAVSAANFEITNAALRLGAASIVLGDAPEDTAGFALSNAELGALNVAELELVSGSAISIFGAVDLSANDRIGITAPGLLAAGTDENPIARLTMNASEVALVGAVSLGPDPASGSGLLSVVADTFDFAGGSFSLAGFERFDATSKVVMFSSAGSLDSSAALNFAADIFATAAGSDYQLATTSTIAFTTRELEAGEARTVALPAAAGPGGRLQLNAADDVEIDARLVVESGVLDVVAGPAPAADPDAPPADAAPAVRVGAAASLELGGSVYTFDGVSVAGPGGQVRLRSAGGNVDLASSAVIDVSSPTGRAGAIRLLAPEGTLTVARGMSDEGGIVPGSQLMAAGAGGELVVDALNVADADGIFAQANSGNFADTVAVRQRGDGNLQLASNRSLIANRVALQADRGALLVDGAITLTGPADRRLDLAARDDVTINSQIVVAPGATADTRASLNIYSGTGGIVASAGSVFDLASDAELWFRIGRDVLEMLTGDADDRVRFDGTIVGDAAIVLEAFQSYVVDDGVSDGVATIGASEVAAAPTNPWFADATAFMSNADAIATTLGFTDDPRFRLLPGVELRGGGVAQTPESIVLAADFNLFDWRFGDDVPGVLTLRSAGDLLIDSSINDGFSSPLATDLVATGESWSYRLIGGADYAAANPLTTLGDTAAGNVVVAAGTLRQSFFAPEQTLIRTGTGNIDVAAAGDIVLENQASVIYTSGIATDGVLLFFPGDLGFRLYPDQGGNVSLTAGRDIVGAATDQLVSGWLYRAGRSDNTTNPGAVGWTVNFGEFQQNVGALGGGSVSVEAGRDILNLSASVPTIGRQVGGFSFGESALEIVGGGNLSVRSGNDVLGGVFLVGRGSGTIRAGRNFGVSAEGIYPILALGDGSFDVTARNDLALGATTSPTLIPQDPLQGALSAASRSIFATYGDNSAVQLLSVGGDLATINSDELDTLLGRYSTASFFAGDDLAFRLVPPIFAATALSGDLTLGSSVTLFPSPASNLEFFAGGNIRLGAGSQVLELLLSDVASTIRPDLANPTNSLADFYGEIFTNPNTFFTEFNAPVPVHLNSTLPARIVANGGDVELVSAGGGRPFIYSAKPIRIVAAQDVIGLTLQAQNVRNDSVTLIQAGRDIVFPTERAAQGLLLESVGEIDVAGPGILQLRAGRDIDLQTSVGVATSGNIENFALPENGASISLIAGLGSLEPDYAGFLDTYIVNDDAYDAELSDFVADFSTSVDSDRVALLDAFLLLDDAVQQQFIEQVLFAELRASGRSAALQPEGSRDYSRGFNALTTLFPGSNPAIGTDETNAFDGDVRLFFSRIYTLDGGDIRILVPGGEINAGLATPPDSFGVNKTPDELGIVAQRSGSIEALSFDDFAVNESRVFAADGGNILIWASQGDIDAGRGAKTAISAPPPEISIDPSTGATRLLFPAALTGSGIQALATTPDTTAGDVDLIAPEGVVNAGDAGIVAGNLTIAAVAVLGADNITFSGVAVGVPTATVPTAGLGNASSVASSAQNTAQAAAVPQGSDEESSTPLADQALGFLDVFILGFGDCNPETGEGCEGP